MWNSVSTKFYSFLSIPLYFVKKFKNIPSRLDLWELGFFSSLYLDGTKFWGYVPIGSYFMSLLQFILAQLQIRFFWTSNFLNVMNSKLLDSWILLEYWYSRQSGNHGSLRHNLIRTISLIGRYEWMYLNWGSMLYFSTKNIFQNQIREEIELLL